jgi:hypothetical protein
MSPGFYTRAVEVAHYAMQAEMKESGSLMALWAAVSVRFDSVFEAERLVGNYSFFDTLDLGLNGRYEVEYKSPLGLLAWWKEKQDFFLDLELFLLNQPVSCFMNVRHGNVLVESLNWFVSSANCQPEGLSYEVGSTPATPGGDGEGKPVADNGVDMASIAAVSALKSGKLSVDSLMQALTLNGDSGVADKPKVGMDGLLDRHRLLMERFRQCLMPYVGKIPALAPRFVDPSDIQLGVEIADMYNLLMRSSFPDAFTAERDLEDLRARQVREEREKKKRK